jgi:hypothetical protein
MILYRDPSKNLRFELLSPRVPTPIQSRGEAAHERDRARYGPIDAQRERPNDLAGAQASAFMKEF